MTLSVAQAFTPGKKDGRFQSPINGALIAPAVFHPGVNAWATEKSGHQNLRETSAVFIRGDECFHHLSVYKVTIELVQLVEPELKPRSVRVATQISKVLQGDERFVEYPALKGRVLDDSAQHTHASGTTNSESTMVETVDDFIAFSLRRSNALGFKQLVDVLRICEPAITGLKFRAVEKLRSIDVLVTAESDPPGVITGHHDVLAEGGGFGNEFGIRRPAAQRTPVHPIEVKARFLELNREQEGSRNIDATNLKATRVHPAIRKVIGPESEAGAVSFTRKEVAIVLRHEKACAVDWLCGRRRRDDRELNLFDRRVPRLEVKCVSARLKQAYVKVLLEGNDRECAYAGPGFDARIEGDRLPAARYYRRLKNAIT